VSLNLLAIDPSLTCSGWALFSLQAGDLLGVGKIRSLPSSLALAHRIEDLQQKINLLFDQISLCDNDVLICEAPTTMRDPRAAFKVEQVRGIFETIARERGLRVPGRLNPRSVQYEVMGLKGKQMTREVVKQSAVQIVQRLYSGALKRIGFDCDASNLKKHQDIVDAILVGTLAVARVQSANLSKMELEEAFAEKIKSRRLRANERW